MHIHIKWQGKPVYLSVLSLAGMRIPFPTATRIVAGRVLVPHQGCLPSTPCSRAGRLGGARGWEGTQPGQLTPNDQVDILCRTTSCSAIKAKRKEKGGAFVITAFVFPSSRFACCGPASHKVAGHCLLMGSTEYISSVFPLLLHTTFAFFH